MSHPLPSGMQRKRFSRWPLVVLANVAILVVVGMSTARETYREWKVDQELTGLQDEVQRLETKRTDLSDLLQRLDSDAALDQQAREKLGMQKPGEHVFVVKGATVLNVASASSSGAEPVDARSNPRKWFAYFFTH